MGNLPYPSPTSAGSLGSHSTPTKFVDQSTLLTGVNANAALSWRALGLHNLVVLLPNQLTLAMGVYVSLL
jgi:hypothetical protein